jgi:hypothetical protein
MVGAGGVSEVNWIISNYSVTYVITTPSQDMLEFEMVVVEV